VEARILVFFLFQTFNKYIFVACRVSL
jgi:hypothetical protein